MGYNYATSYNLDINDSHFVLGYNYTINMFLTLIMVVGFNMSCLRPESMFHIFFRDSLLFMSEFIIMFL